VSKSVIWSSAVFATFIGSAAYVGMSTAMTPPAPAQSQANTETIAVAAKPRAKFVKAVQKVAPAKLTSVALAENRT
jgi:hypothetical protein